MELDEDHCGLWSSKQQVTSKPDYTEVNVSERAEFIVLACDGLWDVFTNEQCVGFIRYALFALTSSL